MRVALGVAAMLLSAAATHADDDPPPPLWAGQISASYVASSGNTNTSTVGASGELAWQPGPYKVVVGSEFIRTRTDDTLGSKRLGSALRAERTLPLRLSVAVEGSYYQDLPSGIRDQFAFNVGGLGHVLKGEHRSLDVLLALTKTLENRVIAPDRDFFGGRIGLDFCYKPNEVLSVESGISYVRGFADPSNYRVKTSTAATVAFSGRFALKFSHQLYRNKPDPGKRSTDQTMLASLVVRWPAKKGT